MFEVSTFTVCRAKKKNTDLQKLVSLCNQFLHFFLSGGPLIHAVSPCPDPSHCELKLQELKHQVRLCFSFPPTVSLSAFRNKANHFESSLAAQWALQKGVRGKKGSQIF